MSRIEFLPSGRKINARKGKTIFQIAREAGIHLNTSCNGVGTCGKCKIKIIEGNMEQLTSSYSLSEALQDQGYSLACRAVVLSDSTIFIPPETRLLGSELLEERGEVHLTEAIDRAGINPRFRRAYLTLPHPSLEDNLSDWQRIEREAAKIWPGRQFNPTYRVLQEIPSLLRESNWKVTGDFFDRGDALVLINLQKGKKTIGPFGLVVDVGTTTLVIELIELSTGSVWGKTSRYNPQITYGEDVISRVIYARQENGLSQLQREVVKAIEHMAKKLIEESILSSEDVSGIYLSGNTIMLHLLAGIDPSSILEEPYVPAANFGWWEDASKFGFHLFEKSLVYFLPCVASFLGADIVAGLLAAGFDEQGPLRLFVDIGTNGEMVFGNGDWFLACSCSAGPAFEGGGAKHGTRVVPGAIEEVRIDKETCDVEVVTVGDMPPQGICGSGLIDLLAELYLNGIIDRRGKFDFTCKANRLRKSNGDYEFVVSEGEDKTKDITITEADIDNLMRAKAALFAGIRLLIQTGHVSIADISKLYIAGVFGRYLDVEKAVTIGLLPDIPVEKIEFLGNTSLLGARMVALSRDFEKRVKEIASKVTYLELARSSRFMDEYVSALFLPHTHLDLFASVAGKIPKKKKGGSC